MAHRGRAREILADAERLLTAARSVLGDHTRAVDAVRAAHAPLHEELVRAELTRIPLARVKQAAEGRLRLAAVEAAGLMTAADVLDAGRYRLREIPGVGRQTADQALAAARQIADAVGETVAVRFDVDRPDSGTTALLVALHRLVEAGTRRAARPRRGRGPGHPAHPAARTGRARRWPAADVVRRAGGP